MKNEKSRTKKFKTFLNNINYDEKKMTVDVDDITVILDWDDECTDSSYLDHDYHTLTGEWLIMINQTDRPSNQLMFDFYHEVGHIMLQIGEISTEPFMKWYKDRFFYNESSIEELAVEATCDEYAFLKMDCPRNIEGLLPLLSAISVARKYPDKDIEDIKEYCSSVNDILKDRRKYLHKIASENTPTSTPSTRFIRSNRSPKFSSNVVKRKKFLDYCKAMGYGSKTVDHVKTDLHHAMDKLYIQYDLSETFAELCEKLISALTDKNDMFSIPKYRYVVTKKKPDNWDDKYHTYYYNQNGKYTKIRKLPEVPEWLSDTFCRRVTIDSNAVISGYRIKYDKLRKFLDEKYKAWKWEVHADQRNVIQKTIEHFALDCVLSDGVLSKVRVEEYILSLKGCEYNTSIKKTTEKLMSYNERKALEKQNKI